MFIPLHSFRCFLGPIFLHTPNLVVYCLLITIALDRLSHVSVRLTIVAYHWIDCPYHWIDCHMCQFGLRLSQNTGSILAYHWINCRLARVVACEYSRIASYLYILGIRVVRIGSKSLPTPPDRWRKLMCSMLTNFTDVVWLKCCVSEPCLFFVGRWTRASLCASLSSVPACVSSPLFHCIC